MFVADNDDKPCYVALVKVKSKKHGSSKKSQCWPVDKLVTSNVEFEVLMTYFKEQAINSPDNELLAK